MLKPEEIVVGKKFIAVTPSGERHKIKLQNVRASQTRREYFFVINGEGWPFDSIEDLLSGYKHFEPHLETTPI